MILIKVEALNIYDSVYAAQDLSAIRGASLSLLEMPERLKAWLEKKYGKESVEQITAGASKATFGIDDKCGDPVEIERLVQKWLNSDCPYATVGVACAKLGAKYFDTEEALLAKIRNNQMMSFSFAGLACEVADNVCSFDRVRPATTHRIIRGTDSYVVSKEVYDLHKYGLDRKQKFLHEHAGLGDVPYTYTWDLDSLATNACAGTLNRKMAIFYADGNNFGSLLRQALSTQDSTAQQKGIKTFDDVLQGKRKEFLKQLLAVANNSRWQTTTGERRIELLLWGGDELMIVVPAWCGWEVAELFAAVMDGVSVRIGNQTIPLKHAMSLVFSHYKAPIHALAKLASQLANDEVKNGKTKNDKPGRATNRLSYLVLESFDHVGEDLKRFRMRLCPDEDARKGLVLSAEGGNLKTIRETMATFKGTEFPRRKVYEAVLGLSHGAKWDALKKTIEPFVQKKDEWKKGLEKWQDSTGGMLSSWYHLAELWDYLEPDMK